MKKTLIILSLLSLIFNPNISYSKEIKIKTLIDCYKNSRIQPIIYGYYFLDDWRLFIGVKIKI